MTKTKKLDKFLQQTDYDAFLLHGSSKNSNIFYLTNFFTPDPVSWLRVNEKSILVVPPLEYSKAKKEAEVDKVIPSSEFIRGDSRDNPTKRKEIIQKLIKQYDITKLAVPNDFSIGLVRKIKTNQIKIEPIEEKILESRKIKNSKEVKKIRSTQKITQQTMKQAKAIIGQSQVKNNELYWQNQPLTSEGLKQQIKLFLIKQGCTTPEGIIVACGKDSSRPHATGSGILQAHEPIIIDIFPKHKNNYFGDMTRTFCKGKLNKEVKQMKQAVLKAQKQALAMLNQGAGIDIKEIHLKTCKIFEQKGFSTIRQGAQQQGFIHSTGHGVGLDLHEPPRIADNEEKLKSGMVLTIEPGLYDPEVGGVRIEDMVLIKKNSYENFNSMEKGLEVSG